MIGVIANPRDRGVVEEFFELFKTPWEFCRDDREYDVILCAAGDGSRRGAAKLWVIFAGCTPGLSDSNAAQARSGIAYKGIHLPLYSGCRTFSDGDAALLAEVDSGRPVIRSESRKEGTIVELGYDLFAEIRQLLTEGQPPADAEIPTLDLHIALLRDLILAHGVMVAEIPPVPEGYRFIACLTHDVDHPLLRNHVFDHTALGFFYRATLGSLGGLLRGRRTLREAFRNLAAAARLPLVWIGAAQDFWAKFDRYLEIEQDAPSTFFVIPFRGCAGRCITGKAPARRAAGYSVAEIAPQVTRMKAAGCEIGLHGIDAWSSTVAGRAESEEIRRVAGNEGEIGVRMHWLYFDQHSPQMLDEAGFGYDSTVGYNETVGYRAGTGQVYRPLTAKHLFELPLHIMDTALFYPNHLNSSQKGARQRIESILQNAERFGGCVTVNWHDRSIAPERCWDDFYIELIGNMRSRGAWFATGTDAVEWFRRRRLARIDFSEGGAVLIREQPVDEDELPPLALRIANSLAEPVGSPQA